MHLARLCTLATLACLCALGTLLAQAQEQASPLPPLPQQQELARARRLPVAMVSLDGLLFVANSASGTVSVVSPGEARVLGEWKVSGTLSDLIALPGSNDLLATDPASGELLRLRWEAGSLRTLQRLSVGHTPVQVAVTADGRLACVSLLWARRLAVVSLQAPPAGVMSLASQVDLPFNPRRLAAGAQGAPGEVYVADAFGGTIARVDARLGQVLTLRSIEGHQIRGMLVAGSELLLAHQTIHSQIPTQATRIHWGDVISSVVRAVPLSQWDKDEGEVAGEKASELAGAASQPVEHWSLYGLGKPGEGAADPESLTLLRDGRLLVTLGGVDRLVLWSRREVEPRLGSTGSRPLACVELTDGRLAVLQQFAGNVLLIEPGELSQKPPQGRKEISLGPEPELSAAERGQRRFYDGRLSHEGWFSCHSCHTDGHAAPILSDTLSDDSYGTPKRVLSLLGIQGTEPLGWAGKFPELTEQLRSTLSTTMRTKGELATDEAVSELAAFLMTLRPAPGIDAAKGSSPDTAAVLRGSKLFEQLDCSKCHRAPLYTHSQVWDTGLKDEAGLKEFNPPSLWGVSQRDRLLHDGRARSLEELLLKHRHPVLPAEQGSPGEGLTPAEVSDLAAFLRSL